MVSNSHEHQLAGKCLCWPAAAKNCLLLFCTFVFANKKRAWKQGVMRGLIRDLLMSEFSKSRFYAKRNPHQKWNQLLESLFCGVKNEKKFSYWLLSPGTSEIKHTYVNILNFCPHHKKYWTLEMRDNLSISEAAQDATVGSSGRIAQKIMQLSDQL